MRCNRCGKPIDSTARYCPHCGSEIIPDTPSKTADRKRLNLLKEYDNRFLNQPKKKPKRSKKPLLYWLLGILFAFFAIAIVCYSLGWSLPGVEESSPSPESISATQRDSISSSENGEYYIVTVGKGNRLSLRSEPDEYATKIDRIDNGTRLLITEVRNGWGKTSYDNQTGWVCIHNEDGIYCIKE